MGFALLQLAVGHLRAQLPQWRDLPNFIAPGAALVNVAALAMQRQYSMCLKTVGQQKKLSYYRNFWGLSA